MAVGLRCQQLLSTLAKAGHGKGAVRVALAGLVHAVHPFMHKVGVLRSLRAEQSDGMERKTTTQEDGATAQGGRPFNGRASAVGASVCGVVGNHSGVRVEMRNGVGNADRNVVDCLSVREVFDSLGNASPVDSPANDVCAVDNSDVSPVRAVSAAADLDMTTRKLDDAGSRFRVAAVSVEGDLHRVVAVRDLCSGHDSGHLLALGLGLCEVWPNQPVVVRSQVLARHSAARRSFDGHAIRRARSAVPRGEIADGGLTDADCGSESPNTAEVVDGAFKCIHTPIITQVIVDVNTKVIH